MSEQTMEYEVLNLAKIKAKVEEAGGKVGWLVDPDDPELWGGGRFKRLCARRVDGRILLCPK